MTTAKRSEIWRFFEKFPLGGQCLDCGKMFKTCGNTVNLWNHLQRRHPECFIQCKKRQPKSKSNATGNVVALSNAFPEKADLLKQDTTEGPSAAQEPPVEWEEKSPPHNKKKKLPTVNHDGLLSGQEILEATVLSPEPVSTPQVVSDAFAEEGFIVSRDHLPPAEVKAFCQWLEVTIANFPLRTTLKTIEKIQHMIMTQQYELLKQTTVKRLVHANSKRIAFSERVSSHSSRDTSGALECISPVVLEEETLDYQDFEEADGMVVVEERIEELDET